VDFVVNGHPCSVCDRSDTPLLFVLRNDVGLKGTRFGCGMGLCGACVVQVDGRPVFSCDTATWQVEGREVTTIEGLGGPARNALQRAFVRLQAGQCGYCLTGILMRADALLRESPRPTRDQIAEALDRHLCRCGAHQRILDAVEQAARAMQQEGA